jgi:hypothetical protein
MKKRANRTAKKALSTLPLIAAAMTGVASTQAKPPEPQKPPAPKPPAAPKFKDDNVLAIKALSIDPALPKAGETVTLKLLIVNESGAPLKNVEWKISGALSKTGTIASVAAKGSQTVTQKLTAPKGAFHVTAEVDPGRKIAEPQPLRRNNQVTLKSVAPTTNTAWDAWARAAAGRIQKMIDSAKSKTSVVGKINGATLNVSSLNVGALDTAGMKKMLIGDGLPGDVAQAFVDAFETTYKTWASKYRAVVSFAYPGLAAWPGSTAAPMPNVPFVLAIGGSPDGSKALAASSIETLVATKLPPARKKEAGAGDAIESYASVLAGHMEAWLAFQQATGVMGKGSVPSFAPPYVPVGPVVMGDTAPATTHLY